MNPIFHAAGSAPSLADPLMMPDWLQREHYKARECVFRAGENGDSVFIIEQGEVEVLMGESIQSPRLTLLGPGALFGEVAALDRLPRSNTIRATCPTTLIRIDFPYINDLIDHCDPIVQYVLYTLLDRLRRLSDYSRRKLPPVEELRLDADGPLHQRMLCTLKVISDLHHAIRVSDIDLHYRPLICLHSGELAGFEALLRWHPGTLMRVSPDAFIEIAERNGLIQQLGTWMLHRAARDWETLRPYCQPQQLAGLERPPFLSLNFSAPELARLGLADILNWCLAERQIPPAELSLELPERLIPVRQHQAPPTFDLAHAMEQVRRLGINLVLDDMGTGSAGLGALQEFPFSSVKIERQFVRQICDHPRSHRVVAAMLNLARSLDMHAMAEGVDNAETHAALKAMGCDYAQGDHYAPPMRRKDAIAWARRYRDTATR